MAEVVQTLETLWEDGELVLSRALSGDQSFLIAAPASISSSPSIAVRLERSYALRDEVDSAWALRPTALKQQQGRPMLTMGDPGGQILASLLFAPLDLTHFLRIAVGIASSLARFHARGLIHRDIKPASILVEPETGAAWLGGLGLTSRSRRERQSPEPPQVIAGTLAYMAPEQTGRMNRSIDSRSDLYAFGVMLYQMLVAELPFTAVDPMELVHCHIARTPVPPSERSRHIPEAISAIVMKLLAKVAEDRYQTAGGVEADLRECLASWEQHQRVDAFQLALYDRPDRFLIPEKLYGREREIETLLAAFDRVVVNGRPELVLVAGYSGVGKSSVVNELHKALILPRGLFASGKFDQYKRDIPYATLAQAFQRLIGMILVSTEQELARWRDQILEAVGPYGQLVVDLVPDLERVIGKQTPAADLAPKDRQRVFEQVIRRFIGVFARPEHPLALFLDDLQWLDAATLDLVQHLLLQDDVRHLLLVGAYRDNEVGPDHPLARRLAAFRSNGAPLSEIVLAPLALDDVTALTSDTLHDPDVGVLAKLIYDKTAGNPFFSIQFLTTLAEDGVVAFDADARKWTWDPTRIAAMSFTDNVVALMIDKITRLRPSTRAAMETLACLGNTATTATLVMVLDVEPSTLDDALGEAIDAGLIARQGDSYTFLHDRIQEAAYSFIAESERPRVHLAIGRLLAARTPSDKLEESVFEIVNQINRGSALVTDRAELDRIAELNVMAGKRAKAATAYVTSISFLSAGEAQLGPGGWDRQRALSFTLALNRAECEFLTADLARADERLAMLASRADGLVELAAVTGLRISLFTTLDRPDRAVEVSLEYLRHAGIEIPPHPSREEVQAEFDRLWARLGDRAIEDLIDLPEMKDPAWRGTVGVLAAVMGAAWFIDQMLPGLLMARMANISMEHGNCPASCSGYALIGMFLGPEFGEYRAADSFGRLGFDLVERPGFARFKPHVYLVYGLVVQPWTHDLEGSVEMMHRAFEEAERVGDLTFSAYSLCGIDSLMLHKGSPLTETEHESQRALDYTRSVKFGFVAAREVVKLRLCRMLRGETPRFGSLTGDDFEEQRFEQEVASHPAMAMPHCWYWIRRLQAHVLAGEPAAALAAAKKAAPLLWVTRTFLEWAEYHFYGALARASCLDAVEDEATRRALRAELDADLAQLETWGQNSPRTFGSRSLLVAAEVARVDGREREAMDLYERAIRSAQSEAFPNMEAIAYELAARFYSARSFDAFASMYLRRARECYQRWGALGKVRHLEKLHPELKSDPIGATSTATIDTLVEQLDVVAVVKAAQLLSRESDLGDLIERFVRLATEHAGAERALLILPRDDEGELSIEAEATTTRAGVNVRLRGDAIAAGELSSSVLQYAVRTRSRVLLDDAASEALFAGDEYIVRRRPRAVLCLPLVNLNRLAGVLYLENGVTSHAFNQSGIAVLEVLASLAAIALERARSNQALRRSEAYLAEAQRLSHTGSFGWKPATGEIIWSAETYRIFEIEPSITPTLPIIYERIHLDDHAHVRAISESAAERGADFSLEFRICALDGSVKTVCTEARAMRDAKGELELVGAVIDLTSVKREAERLRLSLEDKNALLKEVHHRVKNNLQLISSLLSLQSARVPNDVAELFADSRNRVRAMALVHENLYRASSLAHVSMADHVRKLCEQLGHAYRVAERRISIEIRVGELSLDIDRAVSCGLIVNELVSNALKHAFPDGRPGTLTVELRSLDESHHVLVVRDDGIGLARGVDFDRVDTLGLQLVQDLTSQLKGRLELDQETGTSFAIYFAT